MNLQTEEDEVQPEDLIFSGYPESLTYRTGALATVCVWFSCLHPLHPSEEHINNDKTIFFPLNGHSLIKSITKC